MFDLLANIAPRTTLRPPERPEPPVLPSKYGTIKPKQSVKILDRLSDDIYQSLRATNLLKKKAETAQNLLISKDESAQNLLISKIEPAQNPLISKTDLINRVDELTFNDENRFINVLKTIGKVTKIYKAEESKVHYEDGTKQEGKHPLGRRK